MKLEVDDQGPPSTYDFPVGMGFVRRCKAFSYMPFMPTYKARKWRICSSKTQ
ncbi:Solute carrier family 23 member 2 [Blattella germanica]|nr:Solute carrier family 23 member 2 [Blattella germanica]